MPSDPSNDGPDQAFAELVRARRGRLLRAIFETEPQCVKLLGPDGSLRLMNPAGLRMIEASSFDEVRGQCVYPLVVEQDRAAFQALTERVFRGESASLEFRIVGLKGTPRWLETQAVPLRDGTGRVRALLGITRDITDRVLANAALRESEQNYRMLFEQATDGITICDDDLRFLDVNPAACRITGYTREELLTLGVADMLAPEEPSFARDLPGFSTGEVVTIEHPAVRKDGSRYIAEVTAKRLPDGRAQSFVRDVTERKRVETALRESENRLQRVMRAGRVGLCDWDFQSDRVYYSPEWKRQIGYADHEIGDTFEEWRSRVHPDDLARVLGEVKRFVSGSEPEHEIEFRFRHKDGSYRHILAHTSLVFDDAGKPVRMLGSHIDITERVELQAQLLQAQKMESIGRLAGGIAHDFNNLLTIINGTADLAIAGLHGGNPLRQDLEQIRHAGERAAAMTRQLLAMSRQQILQLEVLDLNAVVRDMQGMLALLVGEDVTLELALADRLGPIKADPSQIEQVILNLAVNAGDAMPEGGTLTIQTSDVVAGLPEHRPLPPGPYVMLAVHDTGIGMDEAARKRVFEPFFSTKDVGKGTGLGLSTVYGIVKQSGGSVWVDSLPGAGTAFTIYFPRVETTTEPRAPAPAETDARGDETILLVEDEPGVRRLTQRILESAGYRVLAAANGTEALHLLERSTDAIQLLLTDMVMPGMNGRELASRVARLRPAIKTLYMTGYTADALLRRGVLDATSRVVTKPFTARELRRHVREILDT